LSTKSNIPLEVEQELPLLEFLPSNTSIKLTTRIIGTIYLQGEGKKKRFAMGAERRKNNYT